MFKQSVDKLLQLQEISGTNDKISFIKQNSDFELKEIFKWLYDNSRISGIAEKKFEKEYSVALSSENNFTKEIVDVFRYLDKHHTGSMVDIIEVKSLMNQICSTDIEKEVFKKIVCKNLPLGVDAKTINKCFPNLIPTFDVCLCDKYYDRLELVDGTREFAISPKIDGCRCIAIKDNNEVKLVSRQGKRWMGLVEIEKAIKDLPFDSVIFDGEITIKDYMKYPSKEVYKMTSKIISTKDEVKTDLCFNIFDTLKKYEWDNKKCLFDYTQRREWLMKFFKTPENNCLQIVPDIYIGKDVSQIEQLMKGIVREQDWEGLVIKFTDSKYEWKRSKNWLKVKAFQEMDMYIKGVEEGTNSNKNKLGALICEVEHPTLGHIEAKVGSGYSDDERIRLWEMKDELIDRVVSVQYFEQTENTNTKIKSLRFPVFLELKEQGQEINN